MPNSQASERRRLATPPRFFSCHTFSYIRWIARAKLLAETFPARMERGAGLPAVERLAYAPEFAMVQLKGLKHLILVDTKYELGLLGDEIVLIDEVHTPDSSRYWYADTYDELFRKNKDQRALDKEPLREWMAERGFRGDGEAPVMTDEVRIATAARYILLAEELTQRPFEAPELTAAERVANLLRD